MPDEKVVNILNKIIQEKIGPLSEFPTGLKNTVYNVYYKELVKFMNKKAADDNTVINEFESDRTYLLEKMIRSLKEIKETEEKKEVNFITGIIMDEMKYGIDNAHKYSEINRFIKRIFRRKKVDEIENLYTYFD